ncbi:FRG domain-containing protein [Faecalitalea cylindroides]|uniref:FRG domain-containing protein n=1 Tax=Faecalitalea cylindroides TaxID=39483 RepID=UPI002330418D|nr:FRG domain-containing protein [Faecalitalea cylindroides]MDB7951656.1 FRG domain-containing protein [Faecalitalea cylindroides]MDB7958501.1 FRG domain-containing protein [Faecalitalea cylindroides]MDB7960319.1 FRG domain-containing protein [Faecalitalea cylindroides]MDB7962189.1 FRG domain-containing protein [Faecalitalea cylindroides]MDB7964060.1 FRG domain-containing protein [Faecalitalea cylindroides]
MDEIKSVSEYINFLDGLESLYPMQRYVVPSTFFRGQANKDWKLSPKLYREGMLEKEGIMIQEILHKYPEEFNTDRFNILAKLQHFGFPTRLLDVSANPLVALYFACSGKGELDNDGVVYIFPNIPASWSDDLLVSIVMDFIFEHTPQNLWLDKFVEEVTKRYSSCVGITIPDNSKSLLQILTIPEFAVIPKKQNTRLSAQDGAFFLFGMKQINSRISNNIGTYGRKYYDFGPIEFEDNTKLWHASKKIIIPSNSKQKILKQLDLMGINEQSLFPDIEHQLKYIWEKYK